jgi:hypothetical protein
VDPVDPVDPSARQPSRGLAELIGRALIDEDFRELLYQDRETALAAYELSEGDVGALDRLQREILEQHAQRFSEGSALAIRVSVEVTGHFMSS